MTQEHKQNPSDTICPFWDRCDFVQKNAEHMPELIQRTRERYCTVKAARCARRMLYQTLGGEVVPALMLPQQERWACQIIEECKSGQLHSQTAPTK